MRYFNINTVSFTNHNNITVPIKDKRPIEDNPISFRADVKNQLLDEIASRKEIYGDGGEDQSYKIFDANIIKIVESGYDLTKVKTVNIPLL